MPLWPSGEDAAEQVRRMVRLESSSYFALGLANLAVGATLVGWWVSIPVDDSPQWLIWLVGLTAVSSVGSGVGLIAIASPWAHGQVGRIDPEDHRLNPGKLWEKMDWSLANIEKIGTVATGMTAIGLAVSLIAAWHATNALVLGILAIPAGIYAGVLVIRAVRGVYRMFWNPAWHLPLALRERFPSREVIVREEVAHALRYGWRRLGSGGREQLLADLDAIADYKKRLETALLAMTDEFVREHQ